MIELLLNIYRTSLRGRGDEGSDPESDELHLTRSLSASGEGQGEVGSFF
jgi:hypothetical protein